MRNKSDDNNDSFRKVSFLVQSLMASERSLSFYNHYNLKVGGGSKGKDGFCGKVILQILSIFFYGDILS